MGNKKRVFISKVENEGIYSLDKFLRTKSLYKTLEMGDKLVEISHIKVESSFITGLFVSTQEAGIAPIHKPGDEEDYSAVPVPDGKGFAFPNVFIYLRELNVLAWESNRSGQAEKGMAEYFNTIASNHLLDMKISLIPIMNINAYDRLNNLLEITKVEIKVAEPLELLRNEAGKDGAISDIYNVVNKTNASKAVTLSLVASEKKANKLDKSSIIKMFKSFVPIQSYQHGRDKNKLLIVGKHRGDDGRLIEETVNIVLNRYESSFPLEKLKIAPHLQIDERKQGILGAIISKIDDIRKLL